MLEISISEAQAKLTKLLNKMVVIVDKKSNNKKAVILPYEEYSNLVSKAMDKTELQNGSFNKFIGLLSNSFETDDKKYNKIIK
ncbi:MAG: Unknown protein [uncultured Campylobacterales bacterium]|uniref:Antitoxin n=1 Tax=uncultured Campylobacterales bacterium TaxID=352960 RepID=A0A6S6T0R0_9BACT|nr:MAG: Unknown protein [uncultured Campylobacterales bacterium]